MSGWTDGRPGQLYIRVFSQEVCGKRLLAFVPKEAGQTATHRFPFNQKTLSSVLAVRLITRTRLLEQDHGRKVFTEQPTKDGVKNKKAI